MTCLGLFVSSFRLHRQLSRRVLKKPTEYRKPFKPPTAETPVVIRTISYGGEDHPATAKRVIVVPVARLPLQGSAIHTVKLLAGTRWTPYPPRDSGFSSDDEGSEHGYIKISSEDFPQPGMNLKWTSDVLDTLVSQAEVSLMKSGVFVG